MMENPIFASPSPSDFWGQKWNLVLHEILKRGVYRPVWQRFSRNVAMVFSFVASGIFHEWILLVVYFRNYSKCKNIRPCYKPVLGGALWFFAWNAVLVFLEYAAGEVSDMPRFATALPCVLRSLLVVFLALPLALVFTKPK